MAVGFLLMDDLGFFLVMFFLLSSGQNSSPQIWVITIKLTRASSFQFVALNGLKFPNFLSKTKKRATKSTPKTPKTPN